MTVTKDITQNGAIDCQYECCPRCLGFDVVVECKETIAYLARWFDYEHPFEDSHIAYVWMEIGDDEKSQQWLDLKPILNTDMLREIATHFESNYRVEREREEEAYARNCRLDAVDVLYDQMRDDELCKSN